MSCSAFSLLIFDQMLRAPRGVNFCSHASESWACFCPSIQPWQSAASSASAYETDVRALPFSRSSARHPMRTHDGPSAIAPSPSSPPCEEWGVSRALSISLDGPVPFLDVKRSRSYDAMIVVHVLGRAVRIDRDERVVDHVILPAVQHPACGGLASKLTNTLKRNTKARKTS